MANTHSQMGEAKTNIKIERTVSDAHNILRLFVFIFLLIFCRICCTWTFLISFFCIYCEHEKEILGFVLSEDFIFLYVKVINKRYMAFIFINACCLCTHIFCSNFYERNLPMTSAYAHPRYKTA